MYFKVGDRVKYTGNYTPFLIGCVGTVVKIERTRNVVIKWDNNDDVHCGVFASSLTKIEQFKKGDMVRLKDKFYDMPDFKKEPRLVRQAIALSRGKIKTVYEVNCANRADFSYDPIGSTNFTVPISLLEKVEEQKDEVMPKIKLGGYVVKPAKSTTLQEPEHKFKVGDTVKVIFYEVSYLTYMNWFAQFAPEYLKQYKGDCLRGGAIGEIVAIHEHGVYVGKNQILYAVKVGDYVGLIREDGIELVKSSKRMWTYDEILQAKNLSKELLEDIFLSGLSVAFNVEGNQVRAYNRFGKPYGQREVTAEPSHHDEFNEWIGKCVCLCKLTGNRIPDFIMH